MINIFPSDFVVVRIVFVRQKLLRSFRLGNRYARRQKLWKACWSV